MKKLIGVAVVSAALLLGGCATGYVSSDESLSGGFSEIRLAPNTWRVLVEGNGFTSRKEAEQFLFRRAAELTLEQGKRWFVIDGHEAWVRERYDDELDAVFTSPANEAVIIALEEQDRNAFDAVAIIAETNEAAAGRLSKRAQETLARLSADAS